MAVTQKNRHLAISTPLGEDELLLHAFSGREAISQLFRFDVDLLSENDAVDGSKLIGKPVTITVSDSAQKPRYFHGLVTRFTSGPRRGGMRTYRAEVSPWLWLLTLQADCRIFQNMTAPDIIAKVFKDAGIDSSTYEINAKATYATREYCVQYRETHFNFVSRLLEEEGLYYYFEHSESSHKLVIADSTKGYFDCGDSPVEYRSGTKDVAQVFEWEHDLSLKTGKWTYQDYSFEKADLDLLNSAETTSVLAGNSKYEQFEYPGGYVVKDNGKELSGRRVDADTAGQNVVRGASGCASFSPGGVFELNKHDCEAEQGKYALTVVEHSAADQSYLARDGGIEPYKNRFQCIPAKTLFRPQRTARRPEVGGPQPAVVTGPQGSEIHTDKYGRVKVKFFWDRVGKNDDTSSCWLRVAQRWADASWGSQLNPRVGQEVIVEFFEGNPDRPFVTGFVYNSKNKSPSTLPNEQTQTVFKTRSTPKGEAENYNELTFEDKKGSEFIRMHAENDFIREVENNDILKVGFDKKKDGNQTITIYNNRTTTIEQGSDVLQIKKGDLTTKVDKGNETHTVASGTQTTTIKGDQSLTIESGNQKTTIQQGNQQTTVSAGNVTHEASAGSFKIQAAQSIELVCGGSSIKIEPSQITLSSPQISVQGSAMVEVKGAVAQISGSGEVAIKGAIVMIN